MIAGRFFGTHRVDLNGVGYTLVLDFNAVCAFEDATGHAFFARAAEWEKTPPNARELRHLVHAAMLAHHPEAAVQDAGRLISEDMGILERLMEAATAGMEASEDAAGGAAGNAKAAAA